MRLVAKAEAESQGWHQRYETDAVVKREELERTKMKLTACPTEVEAAIDHLNTKLNQVEKAKGEVAPRGRRYDQQPGLGPGAQCCHREEGSSA